ncbi:MAG: peptide ABC transporter substrate-binding protein [Verrucomicrobiae bacterium]|nr:peptide ABC transporter substrate-binding protein [Verrucomicrobiae bacterium]
MPGRPARHPDPVRPAATRGSRVTLWLLLIAAVALNACGRRESPVDVAAREGILLINNADDISDLDPHVVTGVPEHNVIDALLEGLVRLDPRDLAPLPGMAERWEISPDGLEYTFHLRRDALWSNGDPVVSRDFLLSHRRILTPSLAAQYANMLFVVTNAEAYFNGSVTNFAKVGFEAPDPHTYRIRLNAPTPYFLGMIGYHYSWYPVHIPTVERFGGMARKGTRWTRPENFVGNGPFVLREWRIGRHMLVEKNPLYWDADRVRLNGIRFHPITSLETEENAFRAGQLHVTYEVPRPKLDWWRTHRPDELRIDPYLGVYFYRINVTRPGLSDPRVRRALALAIDRPGLVTTILRDGSLPAYHVVPPGLRGYSSPVFAQATDLEEARRLLAEAGHPGGAGLPELEIHFNTSEKHRAIAEAIQEMWRRGLGVRTTLANTEWKVYLDQQRTLDYQISRAGWIGDYIDPNTFLEMWKTGDGNNNTGWSHAGYDQLLEAAAREFDPQRRLAIMAQAEVILLEELPILPIFFYVKPYLVHPSVRDWTGNLHALFPYREAYFAPSPGPLSSR